MLLYSQYKTAEGFLAEGSKASMFALNGLSSGTASSMAPIIPARRLVST